MICKDRAYKIVTCVAILCETFWIGSLYSGSTVDFSKYFCDIFQPFFSFLRCVRLLHVNHHAHQSQRPQRWVRHVGPDPAGSRARWRHLSRTYRPPGMVHPLRLACFRHAAVCFRHMGLAVAVLPHREGQHDDLAVAIATRGVLARHGVAWQRQQGGGAHHYVALATGCGCPDEMS